MSTSSALKLALSFFVPHALVKIRDGRRIARWRAQQEILHRQRRALIDQLPANAAARPRFDFEDAIAFLTRSGCDEEQVRGGTMDAPRLDYCLRTIATHLPAGPLVGFHVGNFVGMSLAFFTHALVERDPRSFMVSVDPNVIHRGIENPLRHVVGLLNYCNLQDHVLPLTGYSLERSVSNDGIVFAGYDPLANAPAERSCGRQLAGLARLAPRGLDFGMIDGHHQADYLRREIACAGMLLKPGGVLVLDDISWQWRELQVLFNDIHDGVWSKLAADGRVGILKRSGTPLE